MKNHTKCTVRFLEWINDGWVKLAIKPNQRLEYMKAEPTDEGYCRREYEWFCDGRRVYSTLRVDSRDCDGRYYQEFNRSIDMESLNASGGPNDFDWVKERDQFRDFSAEAAGY